MRKIKTLSFIVLIVFSCNRNTYNNKQSQEYIKLETVKIDYIKKQEIEIFYELPAVIEPIKKIYLVPAQPGKIEKIYVNIGDFVKKGDSLFKMDQTQLNQMKLQFLQLQRDFIRLDSLHKIQAVTTQQFEQLKTNYLVTENNLKFLEKNIFVLSPINGIITEKYYEDGEMYIGSPNTREGKPAVVVIEQLDNVKLNIDIPEKYYSLTKKGLTVKIYVESINKTFEGEISTIYPKIDPFTKTFKVEVKISNINYEIKPGMFCKAKIIFGKKEALTAPIIAIMQLPGTGKKYIFTVEGDKAKQTFVESQPINNEYAEIISEEVFENMPIIVYGHEKLVDGQKVIIK